MEEQRASRQLTPERLAQWEGPKLAKHLRREIKQQAALLYEKVMLFRLLDPSFERELEQLGALELLDRYTELLDEERRAFRESTEQSLRAREGQTPREAGAESPMAEGEGPSAE
jgi:hypothetical protein